MQLNHDLSPHTATFPRRKESRIIGASRVSREGAPHDQFRSSRREIIGSRNPHGLSPFCQPLIFLSICPLSSSSPFLYLAFVCLLHFCIFRGSESGNIECLSFHHASLFSHSILDNTSMHPAHSPGGYTRCASCK